MRRGTKKMTRKKATPKKIAKKRSSPQEFSEELKDNYVRLLLRGGSPAAIAVELGVSLEEICNAIANDKSLKQKIGLAYNALNQNVATRLYQEAMKGSVAAMTFWLRNCPPSEWIKDEHQSGINAASFEDYTDDELIKLARDQGVEIPAELEKAIGGQSGNPSSTA